MLYFIKSYLCCSCICLWVQIYSKMCLICVTTSVLCNIIIWQNADTTNFTWENLEISLIKIPATDNSSSHSWDWITQTQQSLNTLLWKYHSLLYKKMSEWSVTLCYSECLLYSTIHLLVSDDWLHSKERSWAGPRLQFCIGRPRLWTQHNPT